MSPDPIDGAWLRAHPLPALDGEVTKNTRGRVMVAGGSRRVPGGLRLTGEAALRAGAGKLLLATLAEFTPTLGLMVPEAAVLPLPETEGELAPQAGEAIAGTLDRYDAIVLGPAMSSADHARAIVERVLGCARDGLAVVLDAAAVSCAGKFADLTRRHGGRMVMTPHHGEMAALTDCSPEDVAADPIGAATEAAEHFGAVIVLKAAETIVATPQGASLRYGGGGAGLATGGSGDVLAGAIAGLLARGTPPFEAAAWGVWLHGEAGRRLAERTGPIGFLGRELLPEIPALLRG